MTFRSRMKSVVPPVVIDTYHLGQAVAAASFAGFPARGLQVFGVTGTNGKTTTCFLLQAILQAARHQTGLATTIQFSDGQKNWRNDKKMTTLPASTLQRLIGKIRDAGSVAAVLEITSHALVQHRTWGIPFDTVIFTNLTHDHLDYHLTLEAYKQAKERLFALPHRVSVVNADDRHAASFLAYPATRILKFSVNQDADVAARDIKPTPQGVKFTLVIGGEQRRVQLQLHGRFNVENALAAAAAAFGSNIGIDTIVEGLEAVGQVPGRLEEVRSGQPFRVILDYAHTPDALRQLFETVRPTTKGRIIHVGGATGNRDKTKRPLLGAIAAQYADIIIVTNEDPDNEEPQSIIDAVVAGVRRGAGRKKKLMLNESLFVILDRAEAIRTALRLAEPDDTVMVTGKGDESSMVVNGQLIPYSDRETIQAALQGS